MFCLQIQIVACDEGVQTIAVDHTLQGQKI
jgi:hypothetical protein